MDCAPAIKKIFSCFCVRDLNPCGYSAQSVRDLSVVSNPPINITLISSLASTTTHVGQGIVHILGTENIGFRPGQTVANFGCRCVVLVNNKYIFVHVVFLSHFDIYPRPKRIGRGCLGILRSTNSAMSGNFHHDTILPDSMRMMTSDSSAICGSWVTMMMQ